MPAVRSYALDQHEKGRLLINMAVKKGIRCFAAQAPNYAHIFFRSTAGLDQWTDGSRSYADAHDGNVADPGARNREPE